MKKTLLLFIMIIVGCGEADKYSNYAILKRSLNITIETPKSILTLLNIEKTDAMVTGPLSSAYIKGILLDTTNLKKSITIPFTYEAKLAMWYMLQTNAYLCGNKESRVKMITVTKMYVGRKGKIPKLKPGAIVLTPDLMREKNLLNDDNTVKGDLCFEAIINIGHIREKDDQHFVVTKEEMDKAIVEYENF